MFYDLLISSRPFHSVVIVNKSRTHTFRQIGLGSVWWMDKQ